MIVDLPLGVSVIAVWVRGAVSASTAITASETRSTSSRFSLAVNSTLDHLDVDERHESLLDVAG